tara:strand:- start:390 stop:599 length:210 start_codon:yes stop_codon:yes gene_type:complete
MNATQDASNEAQNKINRQLIEYNEKQNDLIFSLRKRLFQIERTQKHTALILIVFGLVLVLDQLKGIISW